MRNWYTTSEFLTLMSAHVDHASLCVRIPGREQILLETGGHPAVPGRAENEKIASATLLKKKYHKL